MLDLEKVLECSKDLKLLYVEDNQDSREVTAMMLEDFFKEVILAVDGEDGLEKFVKSNDIDFVLTDINMPKLDGISLCRKIREINKVVPIVILSAHNEKNYYDESKSIGANGYLLKPIDIEQLAEMIYKVIKNGNYNENSTKKPNVI